MRKEFILTGKTVEEAIEAAREQFGSDWDNCEWEIIDRPKKMFLGLKTQPARVRVTIEVPDEQPQQPAPEPKQPEPQKQEAPVQKQPEARPEKKKQEPPQQPKPQQPKPEAVAAAREEEPEQPRVLVTEGFTEKEQITMGYVQGILKEFGLTAETQLYREGSGICIDIVGDGLGTIIGRRGETLDAIQYLSGLVANRLEGDYLRVTVDCGDYRSKRKDTLEALAQKLAAQVLKSNTSKTLEPMNPFERRVIHATISQIEGVSSSSIGEEPNRRVVITSPTARRSSPRSSTGPSRGGRDSRGERGGRDRDDRRGGGRDSRSGRGGRDRDDRRRPSSRGSSRTAAPTPTGPPKETPESSMVGNAPIGKLDLE